MPLKGFVVVHEYSCRMPNQPCNCAGHPADAEDFRGPIGHNGATGWPGPTGERGPGPWEELALALRRLLASVRIGKVS